MKRFLLALALVLPLAAQELPPEADTLATYLNLSFQQRETWLNLMVTTGDQLSPLQLELTAKQKALEALVASDTADVARLGEAVLDIRHATRKLQEFVRQYRAAFWDLLTPAQRDKFAAVQAAAKLFPVAQAVNTLGLGGLPQ